MPLVCIHYWNLKLVLEIEKMMKIASFVNDLATLT
jgi:hypothetical protein